MCEERVRRCSQADMELLWGHISPLATTACKAGEYCTLSILPVLRFVEFRASTEPILCSMNPTRSTGTKSQWYAGQRAYDSKRRWRSCPLTVSPTVSETNLVP